MVAMYVCIEDADSHLYRFLQGNPDASIARQKSPSNMTSVQA